MTLNVSTAPILPLGPNAYKRAVAVLKDGGLVALPTETVYGLAADATQDAAVADIYRAKGRPSHNPLIAHMLTPDMAADYVEISPLATKLIDAFWPGPLTLVLPKVSNAISDTAGAGLSTLAVRCPDTPWRGAFAALGFDKPLVMPSANRSGRISPTTAQHVAQELGERIDLILDGGSCQQGIESTILKIDGETVTLLRPGTLAPEAFAPFISDLRIPEAQTDIVAPGMLSSHYAPKAKVRLNATDKRAGEAYLAFGPTEIESDFNLSDNGDISEAARNLYGALRELDTVDTIAVAPIPQEGIGIAINDRLKRAAAER